MFTIKQVQTDGIEHLWAARSGIMVCPPGSFGGVPHGHQVHFTQDDGTCCSIDGGVVYIMNRDGRTVATHNLDELNKLCQKAAHHQV